MTAKESIIYHIKRSPRKTVFFVDSFPSIEEKHVANVLSSLVEEGMLIRIAQGIYVKPQKTRFGLLPPSDEEIAKAIARRDKAKILPTGNTVLNQLHYSTQVPMNLEFLTTGTSRVIKLDNRTIRFKTTAPKIFSFKGKFMPLLVLALKAIGQHNVTDQHLGITRKWLLEFPETKSWRTDVNLAPAWIKKIIINIKQNIENEQMDRQ